MEVLVVDGMSSDGTRALVAELAVADRRVKLLDNPAQTTPAALNVGIRAAGGSVIVRMDAHAEYPPDYISACVNSLEKTGADVVGGTMVTRASRSTVVAKANAAVLSNPFGVGNSRFRTSCASGYVDTVPFGAYRRRVFDAIGLFDERLLRNQDNELSSRLRAAGGRIYLTSDVEAVYYSRGTVFGLWQQAFNTGAWNVRTVAMHRHVFTWRHFAPFGLVGYLMGAASLAATVGSKQWPVWIPTAAYGLMLLVAGSVIAMRQGIRIGALATLIMAAYHFAYGIGSWTAIVRALVGNPLLSKKNHQARIGESPCA